MPRPTRMSSLFARRRGGRGAESRRRRSSRRREALFTERLEGRQMLAVATAFNPVTGELTITYDPASGQAATVELEDSGVHSPATPFAANVNFYSSDTPAATEFTAVTSIVVTVPTPTGPGVTNNSFTIKGINTTTDRIILAGSKLTDAAGNEFTNVAGRWSNETAAGNQCLFTISGIDDLTVTAGGIINVSGSFVNREAGQTSGSASIHVIGQIVERNADQHTATVTVGETTPQIGAVEPWLFSDTVEIVAAEIDIYANIAATREVTLHAGDSAAAGVRSNLVLPYDIVVTDDGTPTGIPQGRVDLFSTQNITQLQASSILAGRVVAVSNADRAVAPDGPWMINLGSLDNAFNEISLGMVAAPGDAVNAATQGRIAVRNSVALEVVDFGILASTGQVRIDNAGALTVSAPIQATGLVLQSNDSITTTKNAVMQLGNLGLQLYATATDSQTSSGAIALDGPITIQDTAAPATIVANTIRAAGSVTMAGGLFCPLPGSTTITSVTGDVAVTGPIQVGSATLNAAGTAVTVNDHTLAITAYDGDITVARVAGNAVVPRAIQATDTISLDAAGEVSIAGSVFSGVIYGNPAALAFTQALPSITITAAGNVSVATTGSLQTKAYATNPNETTNPQVGLISVIGASQFKHEGSINADGAVHIGDLVDKLNGDVYLWGTTTAREEVLSVATGGIDVAGAIRAVGGTYAAAPAATDQRMPNVILTALGLTGTGGIATGGAGTITAGTVTAGGALTYGSVILDAQQAVNIDAAINTPGTVTIDTALGTVDITALVQTKNAAATPQSVTITSGDGIYENLGNVGFGRIVTDTLTLTNYNNVPGSANIDIDLRGTNNQIGKVAATNFAPGGSVLIANTTALGIAAGGITTDNTVSLASKAGIIQTGAVVASNLTVTNVGAASITLTNPANDVGTFAASNPAGAVSYVDADNFEIAVNDKVQGTAVSLSSVDAYSKISVAGTLTYSTLSIAAGTLSGTTVGTVEFVTTSPANAGLGSLRTRIGYVNDNTAVYTLNAMNRTQPMSLVFGPAAATIVLTTALPTIKRAVTVDGGSGRVEITDGGANLPYGLSFAPAVGKFPGSSGSTVEHVAMYGFTKGSALVLGSGNNTVTDFYAGLNAAGAFQAANLVGLEITGTAATGNQVGAVVFDDLTPLVNRFGGNTSAGILIRNGASGNKVYGSVIGDVTGGLTPTLANGDGIRISGAIGNLIGTPDATQFGAPSVSNKIIGNSRNGVVIDGTTATAAAVNIVRNNLISGNKVGVSVNASKFATLGGPDGRSANVIVSQTGDGVALVNSTDVQVLGNEIGIDAGVAAANGGNGISITGASQRVQIASGNQIAANVLNGIVIGKGVTKVTVEGNTIGGQFLGNGIDGVAITSAVGNTVGVGNTISYNGRHGVSMVDAKAASLPVGNRILGSTITDNTVHGVYVSGGSYSTIGGTSAGDGNVIQANSGSGIYLEKTKGGTGAPVGYAIQGNFVGADTNHDVDAALGNLSGGIVVNDGVSVRIEGNTVMNNQRADDPNNANDPNDGITLRGGTGIVVGGTTATQGNLVANNQRDGIRIYGPSALPGVPARPAQGHWISGNTIVDNGDVGVGVGNGVTVAGAFARSITVGQSVTTAGVRGLGNVIQRNVGFGVSAPTVPQQISIQGNSITDNQAGGISAIPTTLTLSRARIRQPIGSQMQLLLEGRVYVTRGQHTIDIYANSEYSALPNPQAQRFLGRINVNATTTGWLVWGPSNPLRVSANLVAGEFITATVTNLAAGPGSTQSLPMKNGEPDGVVATR